MTPYSRIVSSFACPICRPQFYIAIVALRAHDRARPRTVVPITYVLSLVEALSTGIFSVYVGTGCQVLA